jgi:hypothetical protein
MYFRDITRKKHREFYVKLRRFDDKKFLILSDFSPGNLLQNFTRNYVLQKNRIILQKNFNFNFFFEIIKNGIRTRYCLCFKLL